MASMVLSPGLQAATHQSVGQGSLVVALAGFTLFSTSDVFGQYRAVDLFLASHQQGHPVNY